jgi:DNA-binding LytR/AlgR family response regulator
MISPTALIAEDEPLLAEALRADLAKLWPELQVVALAGDGQQAVEQALALRPTLCFLDIRMPGLSGLEAARALAEDWPGEVNGPHFPLLVFVTAYDQYAVQAFDAQAVDYLLKPVDSARLAACVARLQRTLATRQGAAQELQASVERLRALLGTAPQAGGVPRLEVIQAQVGATVHLVPVSEVIYFEAADKYLRVITAEREHLIRTSLRELLPQLDPARFWQVHRGTVVQARCIASARRDESGKAFLTLKGRSETLTVSRLYAHLFKGM